MCLRTRPLAPDSEHGILSQTKTRPRRISSLRRRLHETRWQSGYQWSALEVGSARPLAIPIQTKLAAASPSAATSCRPALIERLLLPASRTMVTNGGAAMFEGPVGGGGH